MKRKGDGDLHRDRHDERWEAWTFSWLFPSTNQEWSYPSSTISFQYPSTCLIMQEREIDVLESNIRDSRGVDKGSHSVEAVGAPPPHHSSFPTRTIDISTYYSHTTTTCCLCSANIIYFLCYHVPPMRVDSLGSWVIYGSCLSGDGGVEMSPSSLVVDIERYLPCCCGFENHSLVIN